MTALFFFPLMKNRSYFVGVDEQGTITLYRGFPWKPLGISLKDVYQTSYESIDNLPEEKQEDLRNPVTKDLTGAELDFKSYTNEARTHRRVPDLMGLTWEKAKSEAFRNMLRLESEDLGEPDPAAVIIGQRPASGELVELDSVIFVSLQPPAQGSSEEDAPEPATAPDSSSTPWGEVGK